MSWPWRVGTKRGRTVYIGDKLVGMMDESVLAELVVRAVNEWTQRSKAGIRPELPNREGVLHWGHVGRKFEIGVITGADGPRATFDLTASQDRYFLREVRDAITAALDDPEDGHDAPKPSQLAERARAAPLPAESLVNLRDRVERLETFIKVLTGASTFGFATAIGRAIDATKETP